MNRIDNSCKVILNRNKYLIHNMAIVSIDVYWFIGNEDEKSKDKK